MIAEKLVAAQGDDNTAQAIALRATKELGTIRDATLFAMTPPSVDVSGRATASPSS